MRGARAFQSSVTVDLTLHVSRGRAGGLPSLLGPRGSGGLLSVRSGEGGKTEEGEGAQGQTERGCGSHAHPAPGEPSFSGGLALVTGQADGRGPYSLGSFSTCRATEPAS